MVEAEVLSIIRYFAGQLEDRGVHVTRIILFGSRSLGTAGDESDIDIAVISSDFNDKGIFERVRLIKDAVAGTIHAYHIPIDVIPLSPGEYEHESSPRMTFVREGIELSLA
jgi:predicted nucleotidyltransferase